MGYIFIVNHQRNKPPHLRQNPPFSKDQINDAKNDERGLLTTYDLYKCYFLIEQGILTKPYIRSKMYEHGIILLEPKLISIGRPIEIYRSGEIAIITLPEGITLCKNMSAFTRKNSELLKLTIKSLEIDNVDCNEVKGPKTEIGLGLDAKVNKNTELFIEA